MYKINLLVVVVVVIVVNARARFIASVRAYKMCAGICSRIFKKKPLVHKIVREGFKN